jgi:hypothetical protein
MLPPPVSDENSMVAADTGVEAGYQARVVGAARRQLCDRVGSGPGAGQQQRGIEIRRPCIRNIADADRLALRSSSSHVAEVNGQRRIHRCGSRQFHSIVDRQGKVGKDGLIAAGVLYLWREGQRLTATAEDSNIYRSGKSVVSKVGLSGPKRREGGVPAERDSAACRNRETAGQLVRRAGWLKPGICNPTLCGTTAIGEPRRTLQNRRSPQPSSLRDLRALPIVGQINNFAIRQDYGPQLAVIGSVLPTIKLPAVRKPLR